MQFIRLFAAVSGLKLLLIFNAVLTIQDPYPQSLWKTVTARVFSFFICSCHIPLPAIPTMTVMNEITNSFILVSF
jgi:hypothetical protein